MFFVWIVLSVFILLMIVETAAYRWLNEGTEDVTISHQWSFKSIQEKLLKKNSLIRKVSSK